MGTATAEIGLVGLAVMGQNLALNVAEKVSTTGPGEAYAEFAMPWHTDLLD